MSHSKHPPVWFPARSMCKRIRKRENDGSGEIQCLGSGIVHYLSTGPKAFISCKALARALELSLALYIPHSCNNKTDI